MASMDQSTGFAFARLLVNTAAASSLGPKFWMTVTSSLPLDFKPAATEPAWKPFANVTLTS
jgi:hypothetical protein